MIVKTIQNNIRFVSSATGMERILPENTKRVALLMTGLTNGNADVWLLGGKPSSSSDGHRFATTGASIFPFELTSEKYGTAIQQEINGFFEEAGTVVIITEFILAP